MKWRRALNRDMMPFFLHESFSQIFSFPEIGEPKLTAIKFPHLFPTVMHFPVKLLTGCLRTNILKFTVEGKVFLFSLSSLSLSLSLHRLEIHFYHNDN